MTKKPERYASLRVPNGSEVHRLIRRAMERLRNERGNDGANVTKGMAVLAALREYTK